MTDISYQYRAAPLVETRAGFGRSLETNLKITAPVDLALAEFILGQRQAG
jgi:hypothetical protein